MSLKDDLNNLPNGISFLDPYNSSIHNIETIYHYTDVSGLKGILESQKLWISHSYFMNDLSEILYTYQLLEKLLEKEFDNATDECNQKFYEILYNGVKDTINKEKEKSYIKKRSSYFRPSEYILSFSMVSDSLQLWSTFNNCTGYNIGFDFKKLNEKGRYLGTICNEVIYNVDKQEYILYKYIIKFKEIFKKYCDRIDLSEIKIFSRKFLSRIRLFCCFFKNPLFENDKEFRIVYYNYPTKTGFGAPKYRTKGSIIIPYIDIFTFNKSAVKSITIGPMVYSDIAEEGITYFLNDKGYDITKIDIKNSSIPLRY